MDTDMENTIVKCSVSCSTVRVLRIPYTAIAKELVGFFEKLIGPKTVFACKIETERKNWKSKGFGFVQFETETMAAKVFEAGRRGNLNFQHTILRVEMVSKDIKPRPAMRLECERINMGCLVSPANTLHVLYSSSGNSVLAEIDLSSRKMMITIFEICPNKGNKEYKLIWSLENISHVVKCVCRSRQNKGLLIQLRTAPIIQERLESTNMLEILSLLEEDRYTYCKEEMELPWMRTTDFTMNYSIGQCFGFYLEMNSRGKYVDDEFFNILTDCGISSSSYLGSEETEIFLECGASYSMHQILVPILSLTVMGDFPFPLIFKLNSLVQMGILSGPSINRDFLDLVNPSKTPIGMTFLALERMEGKGDVCFEPIKTFQEEMKKMIGSSLLEESSFNSRMNGGGQMLVYRVLVTPCRIVCLGPEVDCSNRVVRQYKTQMENFLRVSFVDEDRKTHLSSSTLNIPTTGAVGRAKLAVKPARSKVYSRISQVLKEGIVLGGKRFEFLAFSGSQLREHSMWMFASDKTTTCDQIRSWMGDFGSIRNVAKCAVRMGQCFSSSTKTVDVYPHEVEVIEDIESILDNVKYCFSDGIGKISLSLATEVAEKCGYNKLKGHVPSAFQIRYAGYKGVVAIDPFSLSKLSLRLSMRKFLSEDIGLDVLAWTHYIPCYLNRQIIILLSTLGVKDSVFEGMQQEMVSDLDLMLSDKEMALNCLEVATGTDGFSVMSEMLLSGYEPGCEPFLFSMLSAFRASEMQDIKNKSRIYVEKGRILMGCLDETAALEYGQVFIQVSLLPDLNSKYPSCGYCTQNSRNIHCDDKTMVVEGTVLVAKNPCVHPGDVRVLEAKDISHLHHMVDCIVFPQKGPRPHPNECSGSDLDGDLYFVTWDPRLIPPEVDSPMEYILPTPITLDHAPTIEEIKKYFVDYMSNDSLGVIANAHLVFADMEPKKARDPKCIELANLFSLAVDAPKTGVSVILPTNLRPKQYPDFLEKTHADVYNSSGVLGNLYRAAKKFTKPLSPSISSLTMDGICSYCDHDLIVKGFESYLESARELKRCYDSRLLALMHRYGVKSEAEIFSGFIATNHRKLSSRSNQDAKESIKLALQGLVREFRMRFEEKPNNEEDDMNRTEYAKASAWYHAAYCPEVSYEGGGRTPLRSFPWILYEELLTIKRFKQNLTRRLVK